MLIPVIFFLAGLIMLIFGGDWFVDGASELARRFHLPEILIGATVVSIGTTLPEVMVSTISAISRHGEIAYGNAIGSVICNSALIAALPMVIMPGPVDREALKRPVAFFFISAGVYVLAAYYLGYFPRWMGFAMLGIFALYMYLSARNALYIERNTENLSEPDLEPDNEALRMPLYKIWILLLAGALFIAVGANFLVNNGTLIARALGVPEKAIALTFVALGTSLPELVTAITSLIKGHSSLSLGNVIGANLFNLVLVSGVSVSIAPFEVPVSAKIMQINSSLILDIPVMLLTMLLLTIPALARGRLFRVQGLLLLMIYFAFCTVQF